MKTKITKAYIVELLDDNGDMLERRIIETNHKSYAEIIGGEMMQDWEWVMDERKRIGLA